MALCSQVAMVESLHSGIGKVVKCFKMMCRFLFQVLWTVKVVSFVPRSIIVARG